MDQKISIVCWKWDPYKDIPTTKKSQKYHSGHVNALYNMLLEHVTIPFQFICVTDNPIGICSDIKTIPIWDEFREMGGCFVRLVCFKKDFDLFGDRFCSIDLDCIIMGNIDHILKRKEDFLIWNPEKSRVSKRSIPYCGSFFMLTAGSHPEVYDTFNFKTFHLNRKGVYYGGTDQKQIYQSISGGKTVGRNEGIYNFIPDVTPTKQVQPNTSILFFNGKCLPDDPGFLEDYPWLEEKYPLAGTGIKRYVTPEPGFFQMWEMRKQQKENRDKMNLVKESKEKIKIDPVVIVPTINFITYWWNNWPNGNISQNPSKNDYELGLKYIKRLVNGIKKNFPENRKCKIILFTDKPELKFDGVEVRYLNVSDSLRWNLKKMYMFSKQAKLSNPTICLDLDVVITGSLEPVIEKLESNDKLLLTCEAAFKKGAVGGSIIGFNPSPELEKRLWNPILSNQGRIERQTKGSERFYYSMQLGKRNINFWEDSIPKKVLSYKRDCRSGLPENSAIVRFHGEPRPHEVKANWITKYWIGE